MKKVDGRKTVISPGVFPYRIRESNRRAIIEIFETFGHSTHSAGAFTLGVIIEHCIKENIAFDLIANPSEGYFIKRIVNNTDDYKAYSYYAGNEITCGRMPMKYSAWITAGRPA